ncbi:peptidase associated/transthyretin-like domain-containing protein [Roseateles oligotrophus]|uniref:Carboxypeptidase regulatory-like domain-containing protein n=1 Tax=Roseateles oligotrophus TaxID=1769250 RepID=A0ABT2YDI0_9BURK|nr:hypothetical protein [Roseateles oligotrophus]MCV2368100.1 hypothetical protein [Roseateles oligotrophus]
MNTHFKLSSLAACLTLAVAGAQAAGPLFLNNNPANLQPLRWDMSQGPIKVYTDIGAFSRKNDGTVFLSEAQANNITAFSLKQWSSVTTSTWRAETDPAKFTPFSQVPSIGVDVKDGATASLVYGHYNEGGFYVIYDVDGRVLEEFFGVPRDQVLGIAMPEIAEDRDGDGYPETIVKATAVMNGWTVSHESPPPGQRSQPPADVNGTRYAGIFTHEFGHAINLSHSQTNGQLAYFSEPGFGRDLYPGVVGCVAPVHHWLKGPNDSHIDPKNIETMFPFIDPKNVAKGRSPGFEMSTVDRADDIAGISNLYPTADYLSKTGSIAGTLTLKDGRTGFSGINIIARNVKDPLGDAISVMSGDQTQGQIGPDGRFRINNLKAGESYQIYTEEINVGGYPTQPTMLMSQPEYWNEGESNDPRVDTACLAGAIKAEAGVTKTADLIFNGHTDGVQYSFLTAGYLTSLSDDGQRAGGVIGQDTPFVWDAQTGPRLLPQELDLLASALSTMTGDGSQMLVEANFDGQTQWDPDGNPFTLKQMALWNYDSNALTPLGALSNHCDSWGGHISSVGWGMNRKGSAAVGYSTYENADGSCGEFNSQLGTLSVVPYLWTADKGGRPLRLDGLNMDWMPWIRAAGVSADGGVVVGQGNGENAYAWIKEGAPIDLTALTGAYVADLVSNDGLRVPLATERGVLLWNPTLGTGPSAMRSISAPKYCTDFPFPSWDGIDHCKVEGAAWVEANFGVPEQQLNGISDDGRVIIARVGSFFTSIAGFMWVEDLGWLGLNDFFRKQGVVEAERYGMENPIAVNGPGNTLVGGVTGLQMTWHVDMKQVYVCEGGANALVAFPTQAAAKVKAGARLGRCEIN